jgi:hypothetical protein
MTGSLVILNGNRTGGLGRRNIHSLRFTAMKSKLMVDELALTSRSQKTRLPLPRGRAERPAAGVLQPQTPWRSSGRPRASDAGQVDAADAINDSERLIGFKCPATISNSWGVTVATTALERVQATRHRRRRAEIQLVVTLHRDDLAALARKGYADAASTDPKRQAEAVALFVADSALDGGVATQQ